MPVYAADTKKQTPRTDPALDYARLVLSRARAEIQILAAIAESPRRSLALLGRLGITADAFVNIDSMAIYFAVQAAAEATGPADRYAIADRAIRFLRAVDCWDQTDERRFVDGGSQWGPGPLCALLWRVPYDPDLIQTAAATLIEIDREQRRAEARGRVKRCT